MAVEFLGLLQWVGLGVLAPAAAADRRRQRVPHALWTAPLLVGGLVVALAATAGTAAVWGRIAIAVVVVGGGGFLLAHTGGMGGADGLAAVAIALLYPIAGTIAPGGVTLPVYAPPGGVLAIAVLINLAVLAPAYYGLRRLSGDASDARDAVPYLVPVWWACLGALVVGPVTALLP